MTDSFDVIAIGNAILDVISPVDDMFLKEQEIPKGVMTLIDSERARKLHTCFLDPVEISGGSAANTLSGLNSLGGRTAFIGKVSEDKAGQVFIEHMHNEGIFFQTPCKKTGYTGRCIICVTPDGERSMNTYLGVAGDIYAQDITVDLVRSTKILYFEGYLFDSKNALKSMHHGALLAQKYKRNCALSLSDPLCVDRNRKQILSFIEQYTDILFANEEEILSLFETDKFETALQKIQNICNLVVITRGEKGAIILSQSSIGDNRSENVLSAQVEIISINALKVKKIIDLTGAGDQFAAGFLYAYSNGYPLESCGKLGAISASEIITHYGAHPEIDLKSYARLKGFSFRKSVHHDRQKILHYRTA